MTPYSIPPLLTLLCFAGLAGITLVRGRRTRVNRLFALLCGLGSLLYIDILLIFNLQSARTALWVSRIDHFLIIYTIPVYIHFFHAYLGITKRRWLIRAAYLYAALLMGFMLTPLGIKAMQRHYFGYFGMGGALYPLVSLGAGVATVYSLFQVYGAIRSARSNATRNQLKYVLVGFGLMGLMNGSNVLPILGYSVYPPGSLSFLPLVIFAVGLFKHDLLDMGLLVRKSLLYSLLTALLTLLYAFLIMAADTLFKGLDVSGSIWLPVCFFVLITLIVGPLKSTVQIAIDRIFDKNAYDYRRTIKQISRTIVAVLDEREIARVVLKTVARAMKVDACALFLMTPDTDRTVRFSLPEASAAAGHDTPVNRSSALVRDLSERGRPVVRVRLGRKGADAAEKAVLADMEALEAQIALPLLFEKRLSGVMVLGEKKSGDLYSREDLDLLETLAGQSALAIQNARAYQAIEALNKTLEIRVAERTRRLQQTLAEKERTQARLIQSESLAAIGQLVAGVAHELNNPMTSVTSLVQAAIEDLAGWDPATPPDEDLIDDLKFADRELKRARNIVASLLGLSRQTQTYAEAVDLNTVIRDALRVLHNQYKHRDLTIREDYGPDLPRIYGNFSNLGQVALNIIKNAIQAVPEQHGEIVLTTRTDDAASQVVFSCRDNGPGVDEQLRRDVFKPFFTTKPVGQGTGLGLYICHEIIQKHGGSLTLSNHDGPGACFTVRLGYDAGA